jgi:HNH endonuclease
MIIDDFVMLGTTVPEPKRDGRIFVCSAGVSPELGKLVRIYPLARRDIPHRWNIYRVPVERNPEDSREASFKVAGDRSPGAHEYINQQFQQVGKLRDSRRAALLKPYVVGSIKEANARPNRLSLAIVHPQAMDLTFEHNPTSPDSPQVALFDLAEVGGEPPRAGARRFAYIPRIAFKDELGWNHLQLRDWGAFELQRKRGEAYFRANLAGALHLRSDSSLLVGNLSHQRTTWLVIAVLNGIRDAPSLFDALPSDRDRIPDKLRREVYERDGWRCVKCGSAASLTVDHVWPHARGGSLSLTNLQTLCAACNASKNDAIGTGAA